jgi:integration host factor subunit alpha
VTLTKLSLVENIFNQLEFSKKDSVEYVESVISILKSALEAGEDVKISGFGKFEVKQKKNRRGRNPKTGETIIIEARRVVSFKPSDLLRKNINGYSSP